MNHQIEQRIAPSLAALRSSLTEEDISQARALARQWLANRSTPATAHLQLAATLLRGRTVTRAFSPVSNARKLAGGQTANGGLTAAAHALKQATRVAAGPLSELPAPILGFLEKAAVLVAVAALEIDFNAAVASGWRERAWTLLAQAMRICPQGPKQSTMDHCRSVAYHYRVLNARLRDPISATSRFSQSQQHLPKWFNTWGAELRRVTEGAGGVAQVYLLWHDCGKPFCLEFDAAGRAHFPDHASRSAHLWKQAGGSAKVARLIEQDMDLHTLPPSAMPEFAKREHAALLLLAALAAINSNAQMFGGFDSDSFKIKAKQLEARGKRLCESLFDSVNIKAVA